MPSSRAKHRVRRAIVLAAGRGSRMGGLTEAKPKCLVELQGKPLLEWQTLALRAAGVTKIHVVRGYLKHMIGGEGYAVFDNERWESTNMVRSLQCAAPALRRENSIVSYADIVFHPSIVEALSKAQAPIAITYDTLWQQLWSERFEQPLTDAETFRQQDNWLQDIGRRPRSLDEVHGQYMGLLKFTPEGWARIDSILAGLPSAMVDRLDMTSLLRQALEAGVPVACVPVAGRWCEVDNETDLARYECSLREGEAAGTSWSHDWRWK